MPQWQHHPQVLYINKLVSQNQSESKFIKDITNGMKDSAITRSVRILQLLVVIAGLLLIIITCK